MRDLTEAIRLTGISEHNLKRVDVEIPLHRLVCLTGVSGSGKSTLVQDVLFPALQKAHGRPTETPGAFRSLDGAQLIEAAVLIDQTPIGRTTRSNPASYVGAFDDIRARFAQEPESKLRRYTAGTFSFNSGNGRCPACGGNGFEHVEMQFLSDVYLRCGECNGTRYRAETLQVRIEGANRKRASIAEVLQMTATEALEFFAETAAICTRLQPLVDQKDELNDTLSKLPRTFKLIGRAGSYGDFFNIYLCNASIIVDGLQPGGPVRTVKLIGQPSGRCTPQ